MHKKSLKNKAYAVPVAVIDKNELFARLKKAALRRKTLHSPIRRLVDSDGDDLPSLVIESLGPLLRIEAFDAYWNTHHEDFLTFFQHEMIIYVARGDQGKVSMQALRGEIPKAILASENGMLFELRPFDPDAAGSGIFADQRLGRQWVRENCRGGKALNLFAHAGAFGVAAFHGGASQVDQVDMSRKVASWASFNLALNGAFPRKNRFIVDDVLIFLKKAQKRGPTYQLIVCDPPTTSLRPSGKRFVARDLFELMASQCIDALVDGGALLFSCNDRTLFQNDLNNALQTALDKSGRKAEYLKELPLDIDFRAGQQSASTKGVLLKLL